MTTKEMSRQFRMLDTKYANIKKLIRHLNMESEAQDNLTDTLDAQMLVHRKEIVDGKVMFAVKQEDDVIDTPIGGPASNSL